MSYTLRALASARRNRAGSAFPVWALLIDRRRTASAEDFNPNHFTSKNRSRAQDIGLLGSGDRYEAGGPVRWAVRGRTGSPEILIPFNGIREGKGLSNPVIRLEIFAREFWS